MRKIMLSLCILTLAVLTFAHLAAADEMKVKATLTGAAEVPGPGDTDGGGTVQVTLNPDKGEVCYEMSVTKIDEATAAHIHEGATGKDGPVKVGPGCTQGRLRKGLQDCRCCRGERNHGEPC